MAKEKERIQRLLKLISAICVDKCSALLSKFIKKGARIDLEAISYRTNDEILMRFNMLKKKEVVASFIDFVGDAKFKFLFFVEDKDSQQLTNLILQKNLETEQDKALYSTSAIKEIANILASVCTNVFSRDFDIPIKPSTPFLKKDLLENILKEYIVSAAEHNNLILMMESVFIVIEHDIKCFMFIIPLKQTEKIFTKTSLEIGSLDKITA